MTNRKKPLTQADIDRAVKLIDQMIANLEKQRRTLQDAEVAAWTQQQLALRAEYERNVAAMRQAAKAQPPRPQSVSRTTKIVRFPK